MPEDLNHLVPDDEDQEPINPEAAAALGREIRFGVTLIGLLLAILGIALYVKLGSPRFPGLPWGKHQVASVDAEAKAADQSKPAKKPARTPFGDPLSVEPAPVLAMPEQEPAGGEALVGTTPSADNRYPGGYSADALPADPPFPIGSAGSLDAAPAEQADYQGIPPATDATGRVSTPVDAADADAQGNWSALEAPPFDPARPTGPSVDRQIERVGATAPNPFPPTAENELPDEPAFDSPLVPTPELELQAPELRSNNAVQPAAAKEPTLAEPRNSPYGRPAVRDRYAAPDRYPAPGHAAPYNGRHEDGPRAAPSAEHTPLHTVPAHGNDVPRSGDPFSTPLERELQNARTPRYNDGLHAPPTNDLDAPASEFAAPQDSIAGHHHAPAHVQTTNGTYEVMPNDSFWTISQKVYGTSSYFKAVQRHNRKPGQQSDGLEIGEKILVPPVEVLEQKYPQLCPKRRPPANQSGRLTSVHPQAMHGGRVYVVEEGDTLFDIARYELGKASRWAEIYDLNKHQLGGDYDYVAPGTRLILPDTASNNEPEPITSRPGYPYK